MRRFLIGILVGTISVTSAEAETYKVSLTRKDSNFYQIDGGKLYLRTRYCYEYAISQEAIIDTDKREVVFLGFTPSKCDLDMILQKVG